MILRKVSVGAIALTIGVSTLSGGMVEQVLYNVVGQVSNAVGARLGDEIYYGSSSHRHRKVVRHHKRRKHKKKKRVAVPVMTVEKKIQKALASLGFYKGKIDGEVNSYETRSAIKAMNRAYGIGNNAFLSPEVKDTLIYLGNLFKIDRGLIASGSDQKTKGKKIQAALKVLGYYSGKIDGLIGSGTRASIAKYKSENGMAANGKLNFEEEYRLITQAKELNDKNIEETIASIKSFARPRQIQQAQVVNSVNRVQVTSVGTNSYQQQSVPPQVTQVVQQRQQVVQNARFVPQVQQINPVQETRGNIAVNKQQESQNLQTNSVNTNVTQKSINQNTQQLQETTTVRPSMEKAVSPIQTQQPANVKSPTEQVALKQNSSTTLLTGASVQNGQATVKKESIEKSTSKEKIVQNQTLPQ